MTTQNVWNSCIQGIAAITAMMALVARSDDSPPPGQPPPSKIAATDDATVNSNTNANPQPTPAKQLFKGKVVRVFDALKRRGVKAYAEELKDQVALETAKGELIPILPDWRGRAFFQDERLRDRDVELIGFRREGLPYLSVMSVYTFDAKGQRQYTDYWCDVCSIPMYEIKPCDCCQQEIRLRFQPQEVTELDAVKPASVPKSK
jgi:hypothetical protein